MEDVNKIAAQVAAEAVINDPAGYSEATILAVRAAAVNNGVSEFYVRMIDDVRWSR